MPMITDDFSIRDLLAQMRKIAVVGMSPNAERPSHQVGRFLLETGYDVLPVNPHVETILGLSVVPDLWDVSTPISAVCVFRQPRHVPAIVEACIEKNVPTLWLQEGVVNDRAAQMAVDNDINVVMDRCIYKEYKRLLG